MIKRVLVGIYMIVLPVSSMMVLGGCSGNEAPEENAVNSAPVPTLEPTAAAQRELRRKQNKQMP